MALRNFSDGQDYVPGASGGGGGGLHFRDPPDVFADVAARDAAFAAGGTLAGDHVLFAADRSLAIVIGTIALPTAFQSYTGDDGVYDATTWLNVTSAVQGRQGNQGVFIARIYGNFAAAPAAAPVGGSIAADEEITAPANWSNADDITAPGAGETTYQCISEVNPETDAFPLVPIWSGPFVIDGVGGAEAAAAAAASATAAETSATGASGSATGAAASADAAAASSASAQGQQDVAVGSPRGDLIATSPTLSVTSVGNTASRAFATAGLWTVDGSAPAGFTRLGCRRRTMSVFTRRMSVRPERTAYGPWLKSMAWRSTRR